MLPGAPLHPMRCNAARGTIASAPAADDPFPIRCRPSVSHARFGAGGSMCGELRQLEAKQSQMLDVILLEKYYLN